MSTLRREGILHAGDIVQVRSQAEILGTLDASGQLEGLPFMPEMLRYCGERLTVFRRADKTCGGMEFTGLRRMEHAVFLDGVRCDGTAHGDCQAGCLVFWKEAWLRPLQPDRGVEAPPFQQAPAPPAAEDAPHLTSRSLVEATRVGPGPDDTYSCQATELGKATTPLSEMDIRQYARDVTEGNAGIGLVIRTLGKRWLRYLYARIRWNRITIRLRPLKTWLTRVYRRMAGGQVGRVRHSGSEGETSRLNLQPGDLVRVRTRPQIEATLDAANRNRGLEFSPEMHRYCGGEFRVLRRVERMINERTGKMMTLRDCIVLDTVTCKGDFHLFCQRDIFIYWREAWLDKVG